MVSMIITLICVCLITASLVMMVQSPGLAWGIMICVFGLIYLIFGTKYVFRFWKDREYDMDYYPLPKKMIMWICYILCIPCLFYAFLIKGMGLYGSRISNDSSYDHDRYSSSGSTSSDKPKYDYELTDPDDHNTKRLTKVGRSIGVNGDEYKDQYGNTWIHEDCTDDDEFYKKK